MNRRNFPPLAAALLIVILSLFALGSSSTIYVSRVYSDSGNQVHVVTHANSNSAEKIFTLQPERGQVGIDAVKIADDRVTVGWLVLYKDPDGGSSDAGKLVIWRDGRIFRTFSSDQIFWSWAFERGAEQVAFHTGPTHGESTSHCELRRLRTGNLLASWEGDLNNSDRPTWTARLDH